MLGMGVLCCFCVKGVAFCRVLLDSLWFSNDIIVGGIAWLSSTFFLWLFTWFLMDSWARGREKF